MKRDFILIFVCLFNINGYCQSVDATTVPTQDSLSSTAVNSNQKIILKDTAYHPMRVGIDILKPILFSQDAQRSSFELFVDYYYKKELYFIAEAGYGKSQYQYDDLNYSTSNPFLKIGIEKTLMPRVHSNDWDGLYVGLRYGLARISRSQANYKVTQPGWGTISGSIPSDNYAAHWAEILMGVKLELVPRIGIGWNAKGKFLINGKRFMELSPNYIAGYGNGEKNSVFDFSVFLFYRF